MLKKLTRWCFNFKYYLNKKYYQENHPDGRSYPGLFTRLKIAWVLRSEPTFDERMQEWKGYN